MMGPSRIGGQIRQLSTLLLEADIALYVNPVIKQELRRSGRRIIRVTTSGLTGSATTLIRGHFATVSDYCEWLESGAYSAVLFDGAILQISYDFDGNDLIGHRLAYYPCPFDVDTELLRTSPVLDVIWLYRGRDDERVRLRSPLRFDFDKGAQQAGHPAVHLTLLWDHCRWAVVAPISLGHFLRFIFRHFYPALWNAHDFIRQWPQELGERTITRTEEGALHISCLLGVG